jgi:DNA-binding response OmpR family regulator
VATVLLVSDSSSWAGGVEQFLAAEGFRVLLDTSGDTAFDDQKLVDVDVAVVDLRLTVQSGLGVCGALRSRAPLPIVAIGSGVDEIDILKAYSAGADQFVPVDISTRQLVARLRAILRRFPPRRVADSPHPPASVEIDVLTGVVVTSGIAVKLSRQELEVLRVLVSRPGRVVTRAELMVSWSGVRGARRLDFVIRRLRQKLEPVDGCRRISVVRGVGFRFDPDGSPPGGTEAVEP